MTRFARRSLQLLFVCSSLFAACGGEPLSDDRSGSFDLTEAAGVRSNRAIRPSRAVLATSATEVPDVTSGKPRSFAAPWDVELIASLSERVPRPAPDEPADPTANPAPGADPTNPGTEDPGEQPPVEPAPDPAPEVPSGPTCEAVSGSRCFYIAPNGSDAGDGTFDAPYRTFRAALEQIQPGDVIYAREGTYGAGNAMVYATGDRLAMLAIQYYSGWGSSTTAYNIPSGTAARPIVVKPYPGEHAVLDVTGFSTTAIEIKARSHWTIDGFEIVGGIINLESGTIEQQTHDIIIRNNDIHDVVMDGGDNPGLVRVDRGDTGGPYNIFIHDNELHGIYDIDSPGEWMNAVDRQHFGAVTTLSRQEYYGFDGGGTGYIEIVGNVMYDLPQVFFFKNPMEGPTEIRDNVIYDSCTLGNMTGANMHFHRNLVYDVPFGFERIGGRTYSDARMLDISGTNAVIEYNTFVGPDSLMSMRWGTGHRVEHNVFFGMNTSVVGANFDTPAYIAKHEVAPDSLSTDSSVLQHVTSDNNCFFTPDASFQAVARYLPSSVTGSGWRLDHFDLPQAGTLFAFDQHSRVYVEDDPTAVFVNPAADDYELLNPAQCPGMGWNAP